MESTSDEKFAIDKQPSLMRDQSPPSVKDGAVEDDTQEVFKVTADGVNYRTLTWQRLILIFLKVQVATGVLGIPSALGSLGAVPGAIVIVGWQALNTCKLYLLYPFILPYITYH